MNKTLTLNCFFATNIFLLFLWGGVAIGQNHHVGLNFIDEISEIDSIPVVTYQHPDWIVDTTYHPAPITTQTKVVADGGLNNWSEASAREAISLNVERLFRSVDVGDPSRTLRISIHNGEVPVSLTGRRLNAVIGENSTAQPNLLGFSHANASANESQFPNDSYAAAIFPSHLDSLSGISLSSPDAVFNLYAGTLAHEIGHIYNLPHVDRGSTMPYPIMSSGSSGLLNSDRVTQRSFSDQANTPGESESSVSRLITTIGTVSIADFNMDDDVDIFQFDGNGDAQILTAHLGMTSGARMRDGDANGDGDVDVFQLDGNGDAQLLVSNISTVFNLTENQNQGQTQSLYDPRTGELFFDVGVATGVVGIQTSGIFDFDALAPDFWGHVAQNDESVLAIFNPAGLPLGLSSMGSVLPVGLSEKDLNFSYTINGVGSFLADVQLINSVPEPSGLVLLGIGWIGNLLRRKRSRDSVAAVR